MILKNLLIAALALLATGAQAQSIGGNASLSVTTTTASVQLPASLTAYPAVVIAPAPGQNQEVFFKLGGSSVAALLTSPSLPAGGICLASVGPNGYVAAITASGSSTLRITQLTQCPQQTGLASSSGGGNTPTVVAPYSYTPLCPGSHGVSLATAAGLTLPTGIPSGGSCVTQTVVATYATACASTATVKYTIDGATTPTSSVGTSLAVGTCLVLSGPTVLASFKAFSATGTLDVEYFK